MPILFRNHRWKVGGYLPPPLTPQPDGDSFTASLGTTTPSPPPVGSEVRAPELFCFECLTRRIFFFFFLKYVKMK